MGNLTDIENRIGSSDIQDIIDDMSWFSYGPGVWQELLEKAMAAGATSEQYEKIAEGIACQN